MEQETFISSLAWILPGFAAQVPKEVQMTELQAQEMMNDPMVSQSLRETDNMDDEEDEMPIFGDNLNQLVKDKSNYPMAIEDLSDDQREDYYIRESDALIVAGKVQKENSSLQVYIYQQEKCNLFVHHEIMLSSFPLDLQWLKVDLGSMSNNEPQKGNYAIVASFLPQIQIWNLDIMEAVQPDLTLGGEIKSKKKPSKFHNKAKKFKEGSHTDAVLSLSLNHSNLSILASGSIDSTVKIWDISKNSNIYTSGHHSQKVKKVQWNPIDVSVLMSCSADGSIAIMDSRFPNDRIMHKGIKEQIQSACWNINKSSELVYGTGSGNFIVIDARMSQKKLHQQKAHNNSLNDVKTGRKDLMYSCSQDGYLRVWNMKDLSQPLVSKKPNCGKLFCLQLMDAQEGPVLSLGNSKGQLFVWQAIENQVFRKYWQSQ